MPVKRIFILNVVVKQEILIKARETKTGDVLHRGHVDELATEPFLLLHREHGTGYRRS